MEADSLDVLEIQLCYGGNLAYRVMVSHYIIQEKPQIMDLPHW